MSNYASTSRATWDDIEAAVNSEPSSPSASHHRPTTSGDSANTAGAPGASAGTYHRNQDWRTNDRSLLDLGPERLDDRIRLHKCSECGKPVLARYKEYHRRNCQLARDIREGRMSPSVLEADAAKRKRRASEVSDTPSNQDHAAYASASSVSPQKKLTKKAARALEVEERRRQRLEKKARKEREAEEMKGKKKKGQPLDVNRQCGVINDNGTPCMRSLTCKTHSMGAKRAVPGRSKSYDELLLEWQKANNPSFLAKLEKKEEEKAKAMEERRLKKLDIQRKKQAAKGAASLAAATAAAAGSATSVAERMLGGGPLTNPDGSRSMATDPDGENDLLKAIVLEATRVEAALASEDTDNAATDRTGGGSIPGMDASFNMPPKPKTPSAASILQVLLDDGAATSSISASASTSATATAATTTTAADGGKSSVAVPPSPSSSSSSLSLLTTELSSLLSALGTRLRDQRTASVPLARRSGLHGIQTSRVRSFMAVRQAFSSSSGRSLLGPSITGGAGGALGAGAGATGTAAGTAKSSASASAAAAAAAAADGAGFKPLPVVAGGGWGAGVFASHA